MAASNESWSDWDAVIDDGLDGNEIKALIKKMADKKRKAGSNINVNVEEANFSGKQIFARVSRRSFGNGSMKPERNLSTVPEGQRLGILTHPSWLVSHSDAMDNHAILRGQKKKS